MSKQTTNILLLAAALGVGFWLWSKYSSSATGAINTASPVILQGSPGNYTGTVAYNQLPGTPALGSTFLWNGLTYQLSQGANGQLFGTQVAGP